jgi:hypothetical protein
LNRETARGCNHCRGMQVGLLNGLPKRDLQDVIQRINLLTAMVRKQSGKVNPRCRRCG